jgi:predicted component of type VI protein secretion system
VISSVKPVAEESLVPQAPIPTDDSKQRDAPLQGLKLKLGNGTVMAISNPGVIGRDGDYGKAELEAYDSVSRRHCRIAFEQGSYTVSDEGSTNGTYLNGKRLTDRRPAPLKPGDILGLGLEFRLEVL